ncbi:MAG: hypothetical protein ACK47B_16580 [Armatimonadota bacterium]
MSTEPTTLTPAGTTAIPEKRKGGFDQRYIAPIFITAILLVANWQFNVLVSFDRTLLAIATSIVTELIFSRVYYGKWPHLASAYISGISVGILLRAEGVYWPYAFCAAISIMSKYVIRWEGRHIWNPSNFGIAMTLIVAPWAVHTLSGEWGNIHWPMLVIWAIGSIIIYRLKRFHICLTYALSFVLFAALRAAITGQAFATTVAPITGPMYQLFIFFMITDPKTTVQSKSGQVLVAFLVAAAECALRLSGNVHAPYYALFTVGPIANVIEIWQQKRRKPMPPVVPA